jgi:hypothetical protein
MLRSVLRDVLLPVKCAFFGGACDWQVNTFSIQDFINSEVGTKDKPQKDPRRWKLACTTRATRGPMEARTQRVSQERTKSRQDQPCASPVQQTPTRHQREIRARVLQTRIGVNGNANPALMALLGQNAPPLSATVKAFLGILPNYHPVISPPSSLAHSVPARAVALAE